MMLSKLHWPTWTRRQWIRNVFVGLVIIFLLYQLSFLARIVWYQHFNPTASSFMRAAIKELRAEDPTASIVHQWVDYENINPNLVRAVIASEDSIFCTIMGLNGMPFAMLGLIIVLRPAKALHVAAVAQRLRNN